MADYKQEQKEEIEAIESIYSDEMKMISENPYKFSIAVKTEDYDEEEEDMSDGIKTLIKFSFPEIYPDVIPKIDIEESDGIDDDDLEKLKKHLIEVAENNVGMAMVFTIVSACSEWLNDKLNQEMLEEKENMKKMDEEEIEKRKKDGTYDTMKSFLAWKEKMLQEKGSVEDKKVTIFDLGDEISDDEDDEWTPGQSF